MSLLTLILCGGLPLQTGGIVSTAVAGRGHDWCHANRYKLYAQDSNPDTTVFRQNHVRFIVATGSSGSHTVKIQTRDENASV